MQADGQHLTRERNTINLMVALYCRDHHGGRSPLCADCATLRAYAIERLARCPFGTDKPTCANCTVHCYRQDMRDRVRAVMRYAGPRMLARHPLLTLLHLYWDSRRGAPDLRSAKAHRA